MGIGAVNGNSGGGLERYIRNKSAPQDKVADPLKYQGHGRIEVYPENQSLIYITAHERAHAAGNELKALSSGEQVDQNITYKIKYSNGKPIVERGTTTATFSRQKQDHAELIDPAQTTLNNALTASPQPGGGGRFIGNDVAANPATDTPATAQQLVGGAQLVSAGGTGLDTPPPGAVGLDSGATNADNATLRQVEDIFTKSLKFYERNVPPVRISDGPASSLRAEADIAAISADMQPKLYTESPQSAIRDNINYGARYLATTLDSYDALASRLSAMQSAVTALKAVGALNPMTALSGDMGAISALTSSKSPAGNYSMSVENLAAPKVIVSNYYADPYASIGASGSFTFSGYTTQVNPADSLTSIMDKINYGEDVNKNGALDLYEDKNSNSVLDTIVRPGQLSRFVNLSTIVYAEDVNFNNLIDQSEDINNNNRLDGGAADTGVSAWVDSGRLYISAKSGTERNLTVSDPQGILYRMGYYDPGRVNEPVMQTAASNPLATDPAPARFTVNGISGTSGTNSVTTAIPDTTVELKSVTAARTNISISADPAGPAARVADFVSAYNNAIAFVNGEVLSKTALDTELTVQDVYTGVVKDTNKTVRQAQPDAGSIADIGVRFAAKGADGSIDPTNRTADLVPSVRIDQAVLAETARRVGIQANAQANTAANLVFDSGSPGTPIVGDTLPRGSNSIYNRVNRLGVASANDSQIQIDSAALNAAITDSPDKVGSIITDAADSVTNRLAARLETDLRPDTGSIALRKTVVNFYLQNSAFTSALRQSQGSVSLGMTNSAAVGTFISGGKGIYV